MNVDLGTVLQLAVLAPSDAGSLQFCIVGQLPKWWTTELGVAGDEQVTIESPFLVEFMEDAKLVWDSSDDQTLPSAILEIDDVVGRHAPIQAIAVRQDQQNLLVIRNLDTVDNCLARVLQTARTNLAEHEKDRHWHRKEVANITADRDEARRREQLKSRVLANMSHEIRTPLTTILGMVNLALESTSEEQTGQLNAISSAANQLLRLGNDILDLSKMQVERLELDAQSFSLRDFTNELEVQWKLLAQHHAVSFAARFGEEVPETVFGDSFRLRQVLSNLVGNAMKFTDEGSVTLTIDCAPASNGKTRFSVQDSGVGIAEQELPSIFEAFTQVDASKRRRHEGAGLGLAIAGRLVRLMGGEIRVESEPGIGSRFWFDIDIQPNKKIAVVALPSAKLETDRTASDRPKPKVDCQDLRILLAEDHATNRSIIVEILVTAGGQVTQVENGLMAVESWRADSFDAIVMDCQMPVMNGLEAIQTIRDEEQDGRIPILALTAHAMREDQEEILRRGANGYITKPFEPGDLVRAIHEMVNR